MVKTVIFLSVIFTIVFTANGLECYACYDCATVSNDYVTSCESLIPSSSTTASSSSNTSTTPSIQEQTSTQSTTTSTTTPSNTTNTTTPTTTTSTESTATNTTTTTSTRTEAPYVKIAERANITFECFSGKVHVNNTHKIVRGCAAGRTNETCETFGLTSCTFCSTDKCNGATSVQSSVAVLVVFSFAYLFKNLN